MKYAHIVGWGCFLPNQILTNHDIAQIVDTSDEWIYSRTGIRQRRIAEVEQPTVAQLLYADLAALGLDLRGENFGLPLALILALLSLLPVVAFILLYKIGDSTLGRMVKPFWVDRGYSLEFAERLFNQIRGFGEYGFPESHSASFALLVYVSCWLKRHTPAAFCCALLNSQPMGFYAPAQLVDDARKHGVEVRAPDVNHSDWDSTLEEIGVRGQESARG